MEKKFVLKIKYGTGTAYLIVDTPDLCEAVKIFKQEYNKAIPDMKCYGIPDIISAEIHPVMFDMTKAKEV